MGESLNSMGLVNSNPLFLFIVYKVIFGQGGYKTIIVVYGACG